VDSLLVACAASRDAEEAGENSHWNEEALLQLAVALGLGQGEARPLLGLEPQLP